jgi:hypothetical protein
MIELGNDVKGFCKEFIQEYGCLYKYLYSLVLKCTIYLKLIQFLTLYEIFDNQRSESFCLIALVQLIDVI